MLEVQGNSIIFYSHYTTDGVGEAGLTVTITVYEILRDGTKTEIVSDGACTEIGDGLYRYLLASGSVDAAAEYIAVFHTETDTVDQQDIPAMWVIDRANVEDIDDILTDIGAAAQEVWEYASRTLTMTATEIASAVSGSNISAVRGNTWTLVIPDLTLDDNDIQFVLKVDKKHTDAKALLFIDKTGLLILDGNEATLADATLTYVGTTLTITIEASVTAQLPAGSFDYGIQSISAAGVVLEPYMGTLTVIADTARATS